MKLFVSYASPSSSKHFSNFRSSSNYDTFKCRSLDLLSSWTWYIYILCNVWYHYCDLNIQGSRHERNIFPTQLPFPVYPPEILSQYSLFDRREHSENLPIHSESQLQTRPNDAGRGEETRGSLLTTALDRGGDTCEDLMPVNIFPDDVASIIGQIPFWKARSTLVK